MSDVRFYPDNKDASYYEHMHRYLFARSFVSGKKVLDISSGEGYGSNILHEAAAEVVGCDIDEKTVEAANEKYGCSGLRFMHGDCREMPFDDRSFDVVVSFETIEHIREQETFINEASRVLRKRGIFIVSTPDKKIYTDERNYHNTDHVRELYREEFVNTLKEKFKYVYIYGERFLRSSFIGRLETQQDLYIGAERIEKRTIQSRRFRSKNYVAACPESQIMPMYIILVCSNYRITKRELDYSYFFDGGTDEELQRARQGIDDLKEQLQRAKDTIAQKDKEIENARDGINDLEEQVSRARVAIGILEQKLNDCAKEQQNNGGGVL